MDTNGLEKIGVEFQMIYGEPLDSRGPLLFEDESVNDDPLEMFKAEVADKLSKAAAGMAPISVNVPSLDEIIGITGGEDSFTKHEQVEGGEEMTLLKRARCSSGSGRIRLEKTVLDGELWLFGFDDHGEEVFARPFTEEEAA